MILPDPQRMRRVAALVVALTGLLALVPAGVSQDETVVAVRGSTFVMGTHAREIEGLKSKYELDFPGIFENEVPAHEVTIGDFRIDAFEVTNDHFESFVAANPEWARGNLQAKHHNGHYLEHWQDDGPPSDRRDHPVVFVTWAAAQAFCRWRGGRLPTEAEWEFAARAGDGREFPWGGQMPAPELVNYYADGIDSTTPVGSYPANGFGLYDMAGNVWEFLYDEWVAQYSNESRRNPLGGGIVADDRLSAVSGRRAVRGASYAGAEVNLRTRWRDSHVVTNAVGFVGFRCAYPP